MSAFVIPKMESNWRWRLEGEAALGTQVRIVRAPVWPAMLGSLLLGGALLWSGRRSRWSGQGRLVLGVAALTASAAVAGVWAWSGWKGVFADLDPARVTATGGMLIVSTNRDIFGGLDDIPFTWTSSTVSLGTSATWELWYWRFGATKIVPLWPAALLLCGTGVALARSGLRARRLTTGACTGCGYDLRGLGKGTVCPECGAGKGGGEPRMNADKHESEEGKAW
ncbi:MAG: hypothetical protein QM783_19495 [Phycisphaerales bacterium]